MIGRPSSASTPDTVAGGSVGVGAGAGSAGALASIRARLEWLLSSEFVGVVSSEEISGALWLVDCDGLAGCGGFTECGGVADWERSIGLMAAGLADGNATKPSTERRPPLSSQLQR